MDSGKIIAPFYRYEDIVIAAQTFLGERHPAGTIPVPIEEIIDLQYEIDIVPTPGLHRSFDIDAFVTADLQTIYVDEFVYESRPGRYRFSLAHEMGHIVLHQELFKQMQFQTIQEWKQTITTIPEREYSFIEWHAYAFGGLVLVPPNALAIQFETVTKRLREIGLTLESAGDTARHTIESHLAEMFSVSTQVVHKRIEKDRLWV